MGSKGPRCPKCEGIVVKEEHVYLTKKIPYLRCVICGWVYVKRLEDSGVKTVKSKNVISNNVFKFVSRKQRTCSWCGKIIEKGSEYVYIGSTKKDGDTRVFVPYVYHFSCYENVKQSEERVEKINEEILSKYDKRVRPGLYIRRASREYKCDLCCEEICKGELYIYDYNEGLREADRYHVRCYERYKVNYYYDYSYMLVE